MKNYKILISLAYASMSTIPFVAADMKAGPGLILIPIIAFALIGGFILGAIVLIRWIIRKIKSKQ